MRRVAYFGAMALLGTAELYKIDHVMFLGHVGKYAGGDIMLDTAKKDLQEEFPVWPACRSRR